MSYFPNFRNLGIIDREFEDLQEFDPSLEENQSISPPSMFAAVSMFFLVVLVGALFYQQVVSGSKSFLLAERNRIRLEKTPAPRGIIFDRNNVPLVRNVASYQLMIASGDLPKKIDQRKNLISQIANLIGKSEDELQKIIDEQIKSTQSIVLVADLNQDDALSYQTLLAETPAVKVVKLPKRVYLSDAGLSHLVGYVSKPDQQFLDEHPDYDPREFVGKANLEKIYEDFLHGKDGAQRIEIDATGRLQRVLATIPSKQGNNINLAIDLGLQKVVYEGLKEAMQNSGSAKATAIAMDPQTGQILSMVSIPDYDSNAFVQGKASEIFSAANQPLINRAIAGVYPSGSTIKPLWAAAAIEQNVVSENFKIDTPASLEIGEFSFPDWKDHGVTDIRTAIAESNNIFFYALSGGWNQIKGLGIVKLNDYMREFRFDQKTGIDLTGEQTGFIPTPEWKRKIRKEPWYIGDSYHLGIGQGDISVTPIELLVAHSAIHNGGKMVKPHLVNSITDEDGNLVEEVNPALVADSVFDERSRQVAREGMRQAVISGSARALAELKDKNGAPVQAAAKTGTAQFGNQDKTHAWFVSFAPYENPNIAMIVLVEGGGEGHATALPVAKKAFEWWFGHN